MKGKLRLLENQRAKNFVSEFFFVLCIAQIVHILLFLHQFD
jgi:hypothetical protein